jgi:hypothetical protein
MQQRYINVTKICNNRGLFIFFFSEIEETAHIYIFFNNFFFLDLFDNFGLFLGTTGGSSSSTSESFKLFDLVISDESESQNVLECVDHHEWYGSFCDNAELQTNGSDVGYSLGEFQEQVLRS